LNEYREALADAKAKIGKGTDSLRIYIPSVYMRDQGGDPTAESHFIQPRYGGGVFYDESSAQLLFQIRKNPCEMRHCVLAPVPNIAWRRASGLHSLLRFLANG
jgi:hypothetical protein